MQETSSRAAADIRFYCDDDPTGPGARWQPVDIDPEDENPHRTPGVNQEMEDVINKVRRSIDSLGVQDPLVPGETYVSKAEDPPGENPWRAVISVSISQFVYAYTG